MSAPPYQKFFWGSYHKHTSHLRTAREHGAYLLLIGALWNAGGKLPADDALLADFAKVTPEEWAEMRPKLMLLFTITRGKLTQARVTEDLADYRNTSGKRKAAGKSGGEATARNYRRNRPANAADLPTQSEPESKNPPLPPKGGQIELKEWKGSPDILAALIPEHRDGRAWALTYLAHCREVRSPSRALVTSVGWVHDGLNRNAAGALRALGVQVILEIAA